MTHRSAVVAVLIIDKGLHGAVHAARNAHAPSGIIIKSLEYKIINTCVLHFGTRPEKGETARELRSMHAG